MTETVLPRRPTTRAPRWLVLVAGSHAALGVAGGLENGDFSLLSLAAPFVALTVAAAGLVGLRRRWALSAAVALTVLSLALALFLLPVYLIGIFHLPQAVTAIVITVRAKA